MNWSRARQPTHPRPLAYPDVGTDTESVDSPSLLELRAIVTQRLQVYGASDGCTAEHRRTIPAQACRELGLNPTFVSPGAIRT